MKERSRSPTGGRSITAKGFKDIEGATNATLSLQDLRANQAGLYRLTASNALGRGPDTTAAELGVDDQRHSGACSPARTLARAWIWRATLWSPSITGEPLPEPCSWVMPRSSRRRASRAPALRRARRLSGSTQADRNLSQILDSLVYGKSLDVVLDNLEVGVILQASVPIPRGVSRESQAPG